MRVLILSPGTRGDVAPATALGAAFVADGHDVSIVANGEYENLVTAAGCVLWPIEASLAPDPQSLEGLGRSAAMRAHLDALRAYMTAAGAVAVSAAKDADVVLTNTISPYGHDIAEGMKVPSATLLLQPSYPSADYPPIIASAVDFGRLGNRLAGRLADRVPTPYDPVGRRIRAEFGLPKESRRSGRRRRDRAPVPVHHGISPVVLPRPREWPAHLTLDGFWVPSESTDGTPPGWLADFIDAGPAPVVVSLGSIAPGAAVVAAVAESLRDTGTRAILQGGGFREVAERFDGAQVRYVGHVPHGWLLPQAAAVVHHAGAGMVSSSLLAGVPSIPMPSHTDQPFWARRLVALGAATTPIPWKRASGSALADAIRQATSDQRFRDAAQAARDSMRAEDSTRPLRTWLRRLSG